MATNIPTGRTPAGSVTIGGAPTAPGAEDYAQLGTALIAEWDAMLARRDQAPAVVVVRPASTASGVSAGRSSPRARLSGRHSS